MPVLPFSRRFVPVHLHGCAPVHMPVPEDQQPTLLAGVCAVRTEELVRRGLACVQADWSGQPPNDLTVHLPTSRLTAVQPVEFGKVPAKALPIRSGSKKAGSTDTSGGRGLTLYSKQPEITDWAQVSWLGCVIIQLVLCLADRKDKSLWQQLVGRSGEVDRDFGTM